MIPQQLAGLAWMAIDQASTLIALFLQEVKGIDPRMIHPIRVDLTDENQKEMFETAVSIAAQYYLPKWTS